MDTQYREYFSQMMYLAGRMALLDDQTSEHWAKLEPVNAQAEPAMVTLDNLRDKRKMMQDQPAVTVPSNYENHDATPSIQTTDEIQWQRKNLRGRDLKRLRTAAGLSTVELASLVGVTSFAIKRWEQQEWDKVTPRTAETIRRCLAERAAQPKRRN